MLPLIVVVLGVVTWPLISTIRLSLSDGGWSRTGGD